METRLDRFGRIVLPKDVRDDYGLEPGDAMEVRETSEGILLTRLRSTDDPADLRMVDGVLVFGGTASGSLDAAIPRDRDARVARLAGRLGTGPRARKKRRR